MTNQKKLIVLNAATQMKETWDQPAVRPNGNGTKSAIEPDKGISLDIALADSELRYRRLFESAQDGILILDAATGQIVDANPFLETMLGYQHTELLGKTLWEIGPFKDVVASQEAFRRLQANEYVRYDDLPLETKNHAQRQVEFVSNAYMVDGVKVIQCNIRDITARKLAQEDDRKISDELLSVVAQLRKHEGELLVLRDKLCEEANHDPLTGLFNQRYLDDSLSRDLSLSWRRSSPMCLVALEIDDFKRINDTFGREAGDMALRECANVLSRNLRKGDMACRLGGDEFALVLPDSSLADTRHRLEQICAIITQLEMWHNGQSLGTMTVSAGIAASPDHGFTAPELLRAAHAALDTAKQSVREKITASEATMGTSPP
jgi:diguanylate cyclase (GGDEF)-like protein/PAS domain S-box-containing protein